MTDMRQYNANQPTKEGRLAEHTKAIRDNQLSVAFMILYLHGYEFEMRRTDKPLASAARECLDELGYDGISLWSQSTTKGGIWTVEQRRQLKTGEV
jgi:hypothetical protein